MILLFDIEGTTTPVSFVYDMLFPFARARIADYVRRTPPTPTSWPFPETPSR